MDPSTKNNSTNIDETHININSDEADINQSIKSKTHEYVTDTNKDATDDNIATDDDDIYINNLYRSLYIEAFDRMMPLISMENLRLQHPSIYYRYERHLYHEYWDEFTETTGININKGKFIDSGNKILYDKILAGTVPDVIYFINSIELPYLARNGLILPLDNFITNNQSIYDDHNYVTLLYHNDVVVAMNVLMMPSNTFIYNKGIINKLGLNDPLSSWENNKWTWDEWIDLVLTVKNEMQSDSFETLEKSPIIEYAFLAGNGAEIVKLDEYGRYKYAIDERYMGALNFIEENHVKHGIYNIKNYMGAITYDQEERLINGMSFMLYDRLLSTSKYHVNDRPMFAVDDDVGAVCAPRGPSLGMDYTSRDYGIGMYMFVVPYTCKDPDAAVEFINWVLMDKKNYEDRRRYYTEFMYGGSDLLFEYGCGWSFNSIDINPYMVVSQAFGELYMETSYVDLVDPGVARLMQGIIDEYLNVF